MILSRHPQTTNKIMSSDSKGAMGPNFINPRKNEVIVLVFMFFRFVFWRVVSEVRVVVRIVVRVWVRRSGFGFGFGFGLLLGVC